MENKLLEQVIKTLEKDGTASDKYFLSGIEPDEIKTIDKISEAYHAAKLSEIKGECFAPKNIYDVYEMAGSDSEYIADRKMLNYLNQKASEFAESYHYNKLIEYAEANYKEKLKHLGEECFTEEEVIKMADNELGDYMDYLNAKANEYAAAKLSEKHKGFIFFIDELRELIDQYNNKQISISKLTEVLNEKATGVSAIELIKISLERENHFAEFKVNEFKTKVLNMLKENQAANKTLVPEDAARSAQDITNETYEDLIEIVETLK